MFNRAFRTDSRLVAQNSTISGFGLKYSKKPKPQAIASLTSKLVRFQPAQCASGYFSELISWGFF